MASEMIIPIIVVCLAFLIVLGTSTLISRNTDKFSGCTLYSMKLIGEKEEMYCTKGCFPVTKKVYSVEYLCDGEINETIEVR